MPQFDFFSFFVQIFWLTIGSFVLYLIYTRYFITNSSKVMKIREKFKQVSLIFNNYQNVGVGYYDSAVKFFRNK
jgi:hypothetical protein